MPDAQPRPRLLHLGCGNTAPPPEWINVDGSFNAWLAQHPVLRRVMTWCRLTSKSQSQVSWPRGIIIADLRKRLPFSDESVDAVYASHMLEHLHRSEALSLLKEAWRVLRPGGLCRMMVPDLESIMDDYVNRKVTDRDGHPTDPARQACARLLMRLEKPKRVTSLIGAYRALTDFNTHKWMYDKLCLAKIMTEAGFSDCTPRGFLESGIPLLDKVEHAERYEGAAVVEGKKTGDSGKVS